MPHKDVISRLSAIRDVLIAGHTGSDGYSPTFTGGEREASVNMVLANAIAPPFRTGTGEITDAHERKSDQIDIVIEYSGSLSFPLLRGDGSRLYLAEGVCAAVEVKSGLSAKWEDVKAKAAKVKSLTRHVGTIASVEPDPPDSIPFFAVGYSGWATAAKVDEKLSECGDVDGILLIGPNTLYRGKRPDFSAHNSEGPAALFGMLLSIEQLTSSLIAAKPKYSSYIR